MDLSTIEDFIFGIEIYALVNVNPTPHASGLLPGN